MFHKITVTFQLFLGVQKDWSVGEIWNRLIDALTES